MRPRYVQPLQPHQGPSRDPRLVSRAARSDGQPAAVSGDLSRPDGADRPLWPGRERELVMTRWGMPGPSVRGRQLTGSQIFCRRLAGPSIRNEVIRDLLSLIEVLHPGALDGADMDKNILAAVIRLDEAKALRGVEPLHCSLRHETLLSGGREISRFWKKVVSPTRMRARPSRPAETRLRTNNRRRRSRQDRGACVRSPPAMELSRLGINASALV
jgi:hypothetical protein